MNSLSLLCFAFAFVSILLFAILRKIQKHHITPHKTFDDENGEAFHCYPRISISINKSTMHPILRDSIEEIIHWISSTDEFRCCSNEK